MDNQQELNPEKLDNKLLIRTPCNACGAQMEYEANRGMLWCSSCSNTKEIPTSQDRLIEKDFTEEINSANTPIGLGVQTKSFTCKNCGAIELVPPDQPVIVCSFCASNNVNPSAFETKIIQPAGILPFVIDKKKSIELFKEWIGSGWFRPNALANVKEISKIDGIYIPFWTYDADTDTQWYADAGYYYYETVYYQDENGNQASRQEQRVRWVPVSGFYQEFFDDVLVVGSKGLHQNAVEEIYPYDLSKVVNYESQFMIGWKAEVYGVDLKQGFDVAQNIMDKCIYNACAGMIPGDTFRNLNTNTKTYNITFKHILLPIWIAAYQFDNKTYQVVINGQTGKISGEKPWSYFKIVIAILFVIIIIAAFAYFSKK